MGDSRGAGAGGARRPDETRQPRPHHGGARILVLLRNGALAPHRGAQLRFRSDPRAMNFRIMGDRFRNPSTAAALALAAAVMLVPANLLPVLSTETSGNNRTDTIFSGALQLWRQGLGAIAIIVFAASIVIPFLKLAGLAWLLLNA